MEYEKEEKRYKKLSCVLCKGEIPDQSVAMPAWPLNDGYCCIECYVQTVMSAKIAEELKQEDMKKKGQYSREKRVFGKKSETIEDAE